MAEERGQIMPPVRGIARDSLPVDEYVIDNTYDVSDVSRRSLRAAADAPLCNCDRDRMCPGECCGIPCCFSLSLGLHAKFIAARPSCTLNVTKLYMLLQFLLLVLTHLIAFYIGRYFCFDGVAAADCGFSPAATGQSGAESG